VIELEKLLHAALALAPSDIHLRPAVRPILRIRGHLSLFEEWPPVSIEDMDELGRHLLGPQRWERLAAAGGESVPFTVAELGRFRVTLLQARTGPHVAIRVLAPRIPTIEELHLPPVVARLARERRGLILVTGIAGSGKSTTLAAMLGLMNKERNDHVVTLEDPVEYLLENGNCYVTQREVGLDVPTFEAALRIVLRQDPNVIVVGEMRDPDTFRAVLTLAQTGHLVLSTMHTGTAVDTVNRFLSAFPQAREMSIRAQLASVLKGAIGLRLVERADGQGLVPVTEVLVSTGSIFRAILEPHLTARIPAILARGRDFYGMHTFDQCALDYLLSGVITEQTAIRAATSPMDFEVALRRAKKEERLDEIARHVARPAEARMEAILVLEVVGMTDLLVSHGDETFRKFSERIESQLAGIVKGLKARAVERHLDGFLMTFPNVDWAVQAVRAIFARLSEFNAMSEMEVAFRGALHYGSTWVDPHSNRVGAAVHKAFRVCGAIASPDLWKTSRPKEKNVVVATEETKALLVPHQLSVTPLGAVPLKGFDGLHPLYELAAGPGF
jgi:twitching motility protein PilT